jgi:acetyl-CoA carboxylase biotin carboxyl carrier protein
MDIAQIEALIGLLSRSSLMELEVEEGGWRLRLARAAAGPAAASCPGSPVKAAPAKAAPALPAPAAGPETDPLVRSPMFGLVCLGAGPDKPAFVDVGATVRKGQTLCLIEVMKLFHPVEADRDGTVAAILVGNGEEVEQDQPLFRID